jgi:hypothetical protein
MLADPGKGETDFSSLEGYRLTEGSPCIGTGIPVSEMEGNYWLEGEILDFWGGTVDSQNMDVGADQLSVPSHTFGSEPELYNMISWDVAPIPFSEGFYLIMKLTKPVDIQLNLFDLKGTWMETLFAGVLTAGLNTLYVNGALHATGPWQPGAYLLQLSSREALLRESRIIIHD